MVLKLFNTLGRAKESFKNKKTIPIKLYACGPTVYKSQHIGNYRTYIFEDVLKRVLLINGWRVRHIMNITDVGHLVSDADEGEDKIEQEARRTGTAAHGIARRYEQEFKNDLKTLNIMPPTKFVRATDYIPEQIKLIRVLEKKGYTYRISDGIYFNTSRVKDYGKLALKNIEGIRAGARIIRGEKKHPTDFALWKFSPGKGPKREMEWRSPWGVGFPGWHIECSAMSMKYLDVPLDIHCGGADHIQIHHSNEIAQSEAAVGKPFARFWMHGAFLNVRGSKMAKSSPETNITLAALGKRGFEPLDFRYLTLGTHYRKPLSFSWEALRGARQARLKLLRVYKNKIPNNPKQDTELKKYLLSAANDDLNTPRALSIVWDRVGSLSQNALLWADHVFGLAIKKELNKKEAPISTSVRGLLEKRERAREDKRWNEADRLRKQLFDMGYHVEDTKEGPMIHRL